jgi:hypothetical protein
VTITATSAADNKKSASLTVNLNLSVMVSPVSPNIGLSDIQQFTATVLGQGSSTVAITWTLSSTGANCADMVSNPCGTIDANGNYTAPAVLPNPSRPLPVTVHAAVQAGNPTGSLTGSDQTTLTVTPNPMGPLTQLNGRYAFVYRDYPNGASTPRVEAGSLVFDGHGGIPTGVEEDNDGSTPHSRSFTNGTYQFDTNDMTRGTISLPTGLVTNLSFALVPHSNSSTAQTVYLTGFSGSTAAGAGRMEQQDKTQFLSSTLNGGFAISLRGGANNNRANIKSFASAIGRFDLNNSNGTIANGELGRAFSDSDFISGGTTCFSGITATPTAGPTPFQGTIGSVVDAGTGRFTLTLQNVTMGGGKFGATETISTLPVSGYIVSATKLFLIETDAVSASSGYTFVGSAEQQTPNRSFQSSDFNGFYPLLMQVNNGPGAGNNSWNQTNPNGTSTIIEGEYTADLDGALQYGQDYSGTYAIFPPPVNSTLSNGLGLAALCPGTDIHRLVMYFVSSGKAFVWDQDAENLMTSTPLTADMIGEFDQEQGGPYGEATPQAQAKIDGTYAFSFEGVQGNFSLNAHTVTGGIAESGSVLFATDLPPICGLFNTATPPQCLETEWSGHANFTIDEADSTGTKTSCTLTAVFTFNDDSDNNVDGSDKEGFGSLQFASNPQCPIPLPDKFVVVSPNKIFFTRHNTDSNISGVAEKQ